MSRPMPCDPLISVIVPVLAEADRINALVDHIRVVGYGAAVEIIVVDGDPAGSTLAALARQGVTTLVAKRGRASQGNAGAAVASGDILLFLHADTRLPVGAFQMVAAILAAKAEAGAFRLSIRSRHPFLRLVAAGANLRSRLLRLPGGAQAQFVRRDIFLALGGFPDIPVLEDLALMRALARVGARIAILPQPVSTSARRWRTQGLWRTTWRNLVLLFLFSQGVSPKRLARFHPAWPRDAAGRRE